MNERRLWLHSQAMIWVQADQVSVWSPQKRGFVQLRQADFEAMLQIAQGQEPEPAASGRLHELGALSQRQPPRAAAEGWGGEEERQLAGAAVPDWLRQEPLTLEAATKSSGNAAAADLHQVLSAVQPLNLWPCPGGFSVADRTHELEYVLLPPDDVRFLLRFRNPLAPAALLCELSEERQEATESLVAQLVATQLLGVPKAEKPSDVEAPPSSHAPLDLGADSRQSRRLRAWPRGLQGKLRCAWDVFSLGCVYAVAICPVGVLLRILGRDPLHKGPDSSRPSYWTPITLAGRRDRSRYEQPW